MSHDRQSSNESKEQKQAEVPEKTALILALLNEALNDKALKSFFSDRIGGDTPTIKDIRSALNSQQPDKQKILDHIISLCQKANEKEQKTKKRIESEKRHALYEAIIKQNPLLIAVELGYDSTAKSTINLDNLSKQERVFFENSKLKSLGKEAYYFDMHSKSESAKSIELAKNAPLPKDSPDLALIINQQIDNPEVKLEPEQKKILKNAHIEPLSDSEQLLNILNEADINPNKKYYINPKNLEIFKKYQEFLFLAGLKINEKNTSFTIRNLNNLSIAITLIKNLNKDYMKIVNPEKQQEQKTTEMTKPAVSRVLSDHVYDQIQQFESKKSISPNEFQKLFYNRIAPYFDFILAQSQLKRSFAENKLIETDLTKLLNALSSFDQITQRIFEKINSLKDPDKKALIEKLKSAFTKADDAISNRQYSTKERIDRLLAANNLLIDYLKSFAVSRKVNDNVTTSTLTSTSTSANTIYTVYKEIIEDKHQERKISSSHAESKLPMTAASSDSKPGLFQQPATHSAASAHSGSEIKENKNSQSKLKKSSEREDLASEIDKNMENFKKCFKQIEGLGNTVFLRQRGYDELMALTNFTEDKKREFLQLFCDFSNEHKLTTSNPRPNINPSQLVDLGLIKELDAAKTVITGTDRELYFNELRNLAVAYLETAPRKRSAPSQ